MEQILRLRSDLWIWASLIQHGTLALRLKKAFESFKWMDLK